MVRRGMAVATDNARTSEQELAHLLAWIDQQRRQDHDQLAQLARTVDLQRDALREHALVLAQLNAPGTTKVSADVRTGENPSRVAEHLVLIERTLDDHIENQSRTTQAEASLRDRDRRTIAELVLGIDALNRTVEAATSRLNALSEEIRHERDARLPFHQTLDDISRTVSATQNRVLSLEQSFRRVMTSQSQTEQADEKRSADLARLDNQVKLIEIRYAREIAEIRRFADEWKARADEQLKPIEGIARQMSLLVEQRDAILARLASVDQGLVQLATDLSQLEAIEKSDRAASDHLSESLEAQARRWEATGSSIWQLGERLTAIAGDLGQLRGGGRSLREELDGLLSRLERADEDRQHLEDSIAEANAAIHAVERAANDRTDSLSAQIDLALSSLAQRADLRYRQSVEHLRRTVEELQQQYRELDAGAS